MRQGCVSVADLAFHFSVSEGTIRRWACEDHWMPHGTRRYRYWAMEDAQRGYDRRHAQVQPACA